MKAAPHQSVCVALVTDRNQVRDSITPVLSGLVHGVVQFPDVPSLKRAALSSRFDVLLVDNDLLPSSGVNRRQLGVGANAQLLVVNVDRDEMCARYLMQGADDAVSLTSATLPARLLKACRRARPTSSLHVLGDVLLDAVGHRVSRGEQSVSLTGLELAVLHVLLTNAPNAVPVRTIAEQVGASADRVGSRRVHVYVCYLRQKLSGMGISIRNTRGTGYLLEDLQARQVPAA